MLSLLEKVAAAFWDVLRRMVGLVVPFFSKARDFQGFGRGLKWALHILVLLFILAVLAWLNWYFDVKSVLASRPLFSNPKLQWVNPANAWLPILFLLVYALGWLAWWLWKLLGPEEETSSFPDIDQAWDEAKQALGSAGINLTEVPLFFVLGRPLGGEQALFQAADLRLVVKQAPNRADAPIKVFANHEGIYVTCAGASLLGKQALILSGEGDAGATPAGGGYAPEADGGGGFETLRPAGKLKEVQSVLARAREEGRGPDQLTDDEKREMRQALADEEKEHRSKVIRAQASMLKNAAEIELGTARLEHVCRIISRDRRPYCPLNGVMVLLPFASGDSDEFATQTAELFQRDLATTRRVFKVQCATFAMISDLETAPGFRDFIDRFPEGQKQRRVGQRFPLVPDLEANDSAAGLIDRGVAWICQSLFPNWVYKMFRTETPNRDDMAEAVHGNIKLYQLMGTMRERQRRFSRALTRWLSGDLRGLPLFGGAYVAGTGEDRDREQAFVAGVFRRLIENQDSVSWTDDALREDDDYNRWTTRGYIILAVAAVVGVGLLIYTLNK